MQTQELIALQHHGARDHGVQRFSFSFTHRGVPKTVVWTMDTSRASQAYMADFLRLGVMYEEQTVNALIDTLGPGDTFLDVGAHVGFFSVLADVLVGPTGKVAAIEADAGNCEALRIQLPMAAVHHRAACEHSRTVRVFHNFDNDGGHALWDPGLHDWNVQSKEVTRTDTVLGLQIDDLGLEPTAIKMDVEGAEVLALRGAVSTLASPELKLVTIEINPPALDLMACEPAQIYEIMEGAGFKTDTYPVVGGTVDNVIYRR